MSQDKSKAVFNQVQNEVRSDLANLKKLHEVMLSKVNNQPPSEEVRNWILDVYTDKFLEMNAKMLRIGIEMGGVHTRDFGSYISSIISLSNDLAFEINPPQVKVLTDALSTNLNNAMKSTGEIFTNIRSKLWISDWQGLENVKPLEFVTDERKRYVSAFDELQKARDCLNGKVEDVTLHLRPAINQSLLERFGFKEIRPMKRFIEDAKKLNFPLPSYDFIYEIFDEGSDRLHAGKAPTTWEAQEMIRTVSNFIDALDLIEVTNEEIEEFKKNSTTVK